MRRLSATVVLLTALAAFGATSGTPAVAQPGKEVAKHLFDEGVELEKKSDYAGALAKYREASRITVTAGLRFHEGYCLEQLGKLVDALAAYEKSIELAHQQGKPDVEKATEARAEPLRRRVPQLSVRVTPPDAEVALDGTALAPALLDGRPFRIDPGEHTLVARAPLFRELTRHVSALESATTPVELSLEKQGPTTTEPSASPPTGSESRDLTLPIAATTGAVVLLAGGIVSFVVAGSAQDDAKKTCSVSVTCDDQRGKIRTFDALAIAGVASGVGLGVLAAVLWSRGPQVKIGPTAAWLEGTF